MKDIRLLLFIICLSLFLNLIFCQFSFATLYIVNDHEGNNICMTNNENEIAKYKLLGYEICILGGSEQGTSESTEEEIIQEPQIIPETEGICNPAIAQISFRIESDIMFPDLSVKISKNVTFPDIKVKIGENVNFEDFSVRITSSRNQADFIITKSRYPELTVRVSEDVLFFPDIRIKFGEDVIFADVTIKIKKTGTADYIVYTEKEYISLEELVVALLPAINKEMDYEFKKIPIYID